MTQLQQKQNPIKASAKPHGFTLLEILIASGLLAIVGALMLTSISSSIDVKERVELTSNRYHVIRQAMTRMVDELSMAYLSKHTAAMELKVKTGLKGESDELHFTAFGGVPMKEDIKEADQREISYFLGQDDRTGTESLLRREQPNPDLELDEGGRVQTLLPNVVDMELMYWDKRSEEWKEKWDTEDSATTGILPSRIKISFTALLDNGDEQTFTTQTKIWLDTPWAFRN
jgi:general secretion pathway protein J